MTAASATRSAPASRRAVGAVLVLAAAALVASAAVLLIARAAIAAGASADYSPFSATTLAAFSAGGLLVGLAGWSVVRRVAARPARVLRVLVPVVVLVTLVPDLLFAPSIPGASTTAVVALMLMHVVVAAVGVPVYRSVAPLPADRA